MKRYSSYCKAPDCPFNDCERHTSRNVRHKEAYDFRGTCDEYAQYIVSKLNRILSQKDQKW